MQARHGSTLSLGVRSQYLSSDFIPGRGGIAGRRRMGPQRMRWLDGITDSMDMSLGVGDRQGGLACCDSWGRKDLDTTE